MSPLSTAERINCDSSRYDYRTRTHLVAAAAHGIRGRVEGRDAGGQVHLTDDTPATYALNAHKAVARSPAAALRGTTTLSEAAEIISRLTGVSEIDYETAKAERLRGRPERSPNPADLPTIDRHAASAAARGADYVTIRRLAESLGVTTAPGLAALRKLLAETRPDRYPAPLPLYRVAASLQPLDEPLDAQQHAQRCLAPDDPQRFRAT